MFNQDTSTEFLSVQDSSVSIDVQGTLYGAVRLRLGEQHLIHNRRVYEFMILLGDLGGLFGSLIFIGAVFHALTVDNAVAVHLLKHYFLVEPENSPQKSSNRHLRA